MPATAEQNAWLTKVLGFDPESADQTDDELAIEPAGAATDDAAWEKLHNILMIIYLKIGSYAETPEQEASWLSRTDEALGAWNRHDPSTPEQIDALGAEMTASAKKQSVAAVPLKKWLKAFEACRTQADGLKTALLGQLKAASADAEVAGFEKGWAVLEHELAAVDGAIGDGFETAKKATPAQRAAVMARTGDTARATIEQSTLLKNIDGSGAHRTTIVTDLTAAIESFGRSAKVEA